jgi:predicted CoA-substrate-specific enzyme activase
LNFSEERVARLSYSSQNIYSIAGKCGVFAETDINSLQKQGIPEDALIVSLFQAIVEQNLTVLTRGYVPAPDVLLLGGPNVFFPALRDAWSERISTLWQEREVLKGPDYGPRIYSPEDALYFCAYGAAFLGFEEEKDSYLVSAHDLSNLKQLETKSRQKKRTAEKYVFFKDEDDRSAFHDKYERVSQSNMQFFNAGEFRAYIGVDGGSTSTKGVVLDENEQVICSAYKLSEGNPLTDAQSILLELKKKLEERGFHIDVQGIGFTGYAKDLLNEAFDGDVAVVETVAHTLGTLKYFPDADVICDVGGQDIKVILLTEGTVKDFRLNTQCSAGNGYYLQSTASRFGYDVDEYAEVAFQAQDTPSFNFGCAVFMESDIVNFQQLGWLPREIMAGLAKVLPLNIWLYVVQEPNLARLGKVFVLQGGTHNNLAVVKAQIDFITSRVRDARIYVHPFNKVAGAIGAALEAKRRLTAAPMKNRKTTHEAARFIGFDSLHSISYSATRSEDTRCSFCNNRCQRTFISIQAGNSYRKYIIASCEKGQAHDKEELKQILRKSGRRKKAPNFIEIANRESFHSFLQSPLQMPSIVRKTGRNKKPINSVVLGIPRILNIYSTAPFFMTYFESLGIKKVVFSDFTSESLYKKTAGRGSIDPCFPSKIAIAHMYDLIHNKNVTHIFFPCLRTLREEIFTREKHWACPVVAATPEVVKAAFTLEIDEFSERKISYLDPVLDMAEWDLFSRQLFRSLRTVLSIGKKLHQEAMELALKIWSGYLDNLQKKAENLIVELEKMGEIGIVLLGRPYHNDPGINHGILDQLNKCGYPIFTIESLPKAGSMTQRLFKRDLERGKIRHALDISDVWPKCYSENTSLKIWAAKFVSKHPNLIALDLSSFRCGHDAPTYSVIDDIFNGTDSPYFTFHEIDENKPLGSIKLRVETIDYFLKRLQEEALKCQKSSLAV